MEINLKNKEASLQKVTNLIYIKVVYHSEAYALAGSAFLFCSYLSSIRNLVKRKPIRFLPLPFPPSLQYESWTKCSINLSSPV